MSIKLDLTKFKHARSEGDHTVLVHKDGHELKVAHAKLSKEGQAQMAALAKLSADSKQPIDKGTERHEAQMAMAKGGKVEDDKKKKRSPQTIYAHQAKDGVEAANAVRKSGEEVENGATIIIEGQDKGKDFGKVKGPKGNKPEVFAEGGVAGEQSDLDLFARPQKAEMPPTDVSAAKEMMAFDPSKPAQEPAVSPEVTGMDPAMARKREIYNSQVAGSNGISLQDPSTITFGKDGQGPQQFDAQAWSKAEQAFAKEQAANAAQATGAQQSAINDNAARAQAGLPPVNVPNVPQGPPLPQAQGPQLPNPLGQQAQPQAAGMPGFGDAEGMIKSGFQNQMQGVQQQAKAQAGLGQEQEGILQQQQRAQQDAKIAYQRSYDELETERQAHMQDIRDAHIDPNKYWTGDKDGNGSHSKVMSAIGMIIAGFNPTSQPNAAINMLKTQMDQNLQAQKENLGAEQNLLTANLKQFGNLKDATDMTRLMQADMVTNQLQTAAAKASTPMAAAAALSAAGKLQQEYAPLVQQFAMRRAMMGLADQGAKGGDPSNTAAAEQMIAYARMTNPEMAKEMENRLIPGVGMAKIPVPDGVRQEMIHKQSLASKAQDLLAYSKQHSNLIPGTPEYNYGASKALALQQQVREGMLGGVFKEGEKPLLEAFVTDNPAGAFKAFTTQPRLKAVIDSNAASLNMLRSAYGLPQVQAAPAAGQGPVKGSDGKMYIQQGRYMVPYSPAAKGK